MLDNFSIKDFNNFFSKYHSSFVRFASTYVRDNGMAEDLVSDAFAKLWERRAQLEPGTNHQAYILTIIKHNCLNYLKRMSLQQDIMNNLKDLQQWELQTRINTLEDCNPQDIFSDEIKELVNESLKKMAPKTLEVFILSRKQFKTNKEIAEQLGISTKGVEFHITKALKELRGSLKDYMPFIILLII